MARITTFDITDRVGATGLARLTGGLYLAFMVTSVLANVLGNIGLGNARQIYGAITTSEWSFRLGLVVAFVSAFLFLMAAWGLYVLPQPGAAGAPCPRRLAGLLNQGHPTEREVAHLRLTFDHDVINGAPAARFAVRLLELLASGTAVQQADMGQAGAHERGSTAATRSDNGSQDDPRTGCPAGAGVLRRTKGKP